jgi:hypothetical protein
MLKARRFADKDDSTHEDRANGDTPMPTRTAAAIGLAMLLAGCSTVGVPLDSGSRLRALDPARDDIASLVFAFDLPRGIGLQPDISAIEITGPAQMKAMLTDADADGIGDRLPAPGQGRAYYFAGFSPADQVAIRRLQRTHPADLGLSTALRFCRSGDVDPALVTISVLVVQPNGAQLAPLLDHQVLAKVAGGATLPACG